MDACGVCLGDNSTCTDCSGVVNGNKVRDLCGQCLAESDPRFGNSCIKLGLVKPSLLSIASLHTLHIPGAGIDAYTSVVCTFVLGATR